MALFSLLAYELQKRGLIIDCLEAHFVEDGRHLKPSLVASNQRRDALRCMDMSMGHRLGDRLLLACIGPLI
jgi:hypothetical protein